MKKLIISLLLSSFFLSLAIGQDMLDLENSPIADRILAKKMAFFTDKLQLSSEEFQNFWPLFTQFEKEQRQIRLKYRTKRTAFKYMTDDEAEAFIENNFKMEEEILSLKKDYYSKFRKVMPVRKLAMVNKVNREFKEEILKQLRERRKNRQD